MNERDDVALGLSDVYNALLSIVETEGETVYTNRAGDVPSSGEGTSACFYVHHKVPGDYSTAELTREEPENLVPGCIIGRVLHKAGVPLSYLLSQEERPADSLPWWESPSAANFAWEVQRKQDRGLTWREAFDSAVRAQSDDLKAEGIIS